MWTLAFHPRIPQNIRNEVSRWGTCKDEYEEGSNGWQQQLYIREARRMKSDYVMTQKNCKRIEIVNAPKFNANMWLVYITDFQIDVQSKASVQI